MKPFIFITNDDGVQARGLRRIIEVARQFADVLVIAPDGARSGMSHAITMAHPVRLKLLEQSEGLTIYSCSGTPVDCVKMGYDYVFVGEVPLLNISGINHGSNSAINVLYSGTMGAAIEGSFYGAPSLGLSLDDHSEGADFDATAAFANEFIPKMLALENAAGLCLNVNIPVGRPEEIRGVRACRQCKGFWKEEFVKRQDPDGRDYFWLTGAFFNEEPDCDETDEWALAHKYISVVPIQTDMTDFRRMEIVKRII